MGQFYFDTIKFSPSRTPQNALIEHIKVEGEIPLVLENNSLPQTTPDRYHKWSYTQFSDQVNFLTIPFKGLGGSSAAIEIRRSQVFSASISNIGLFAAGTVNNFTFSIAGCDPQSCANANKYVDQNQNLWDYAEATGQRNEDGSISNLPVNVMITSALYGDANGDGKTDLLFRFSDGTALLFLQRNEPINLTLSRPAPNVAALVKMGMAWLVEITGD